ncbi:hypothetical protein SERLADRAFT_378622 [Serpula lacrymans var. lacrymans S7.9]|uniref:Uncharacterized protein n=1 Tax=Serpula lacrymans var. lacrymans (strain S7.9) TaxID=578457 RepID=F8NJ79_SERL9|nr:uncharacterized protein SERLADRAFT_378622 [Serpula lacrymans var. lacrymans S7.9]EGO29563.1 hypothetical protein SERLADRAFT_378622 [Serpula lacrymans var. lacrymans S7.9]
MRCSQVGSVPGLCSSTFSFFAWCLWIPDHHANIPAATTATPPTIVAGRPLGTGGGCAFLFMVVVAER